MDWNQLGMTLAQNGATFIGNAANRAIGNRQNRKAWLKNLEDQKAYEKEMANYQQALSLDLWNKTNVGAQVEHLKKEGLNIGLMYGGAGPGGTTSGSGKGSNPGGPSMADGGQGFDILGAKQAMANIKLTEAATKKTEAEAEKTAGVDTESAEIGIEKAKQEIQNLKVKQAIDEYETKLKEIESKVGEATLSEQIESIKEANKILIAQAREQMKSADFSEENYNNLIAQANIATLQAITGLELTEANISKTRTEQELKQQEIIFQKFENKLAEKGITTKDNVLLRVLQTWLSDTNGITEKGEIKQSRVPMIMRFLDAIEPQFIKDANEKMKNQK